MRTEKNQRALFQVSQAWTRGLQTKGISEGFPENKWVSVLQQLIARRLVDDIIGFINIVGIAGAFFQRWLKFLHNFGLWLPFTPEHYVSMMLSPVPVEVIATTLEKLPAMFSFIPAYAGSAIRLGL